MGRNRRRSWVNQTPNNSYFSNTSPEIDKSVILTVTEFETMRLKHYQRLTQQEAAQRMGVSQPTFSRILEDAHQNVTQALMEGKSIQVYGGNFDFKLGFIGYGCLDCNHEWEDKLASKKRRIQCVKCQSKNVYYLMKEPI